MFVPLIFGHLEQPHVVPDAHRAQSDEEVGESNPDQAEPRPAHVPAMAVTGLANRTVQRICPEALVVGSPIVVAGEAKAGWKWEDEKCRRKRKEPRNPRRPAAVDPRMWRIGEE